MNNLTQSALSAVAVLALVLGPALSALWFIQRRKRIARRLRRSPLTTELLRTPGHTLREQVEELRVDSSFDLAMLMVMPSFPLAYFMIHATLTETVPPLGILLLSVAAAAVFTAIMIRRMLRQAALHDRVRLGLDAELAVGQELDQLMREGAVVFHDLPAEHFNIDHVVIAPRGVFAVETKGYSKPNRNAGTADATAVYDGRSLTLPQRSATEAVEQTARQARWLSNWLQSSTGHPVRVTPVLALPGWFIDRKGRGEVLVFSGRELRGNLLKARSAAPLAADQMQRVVHQIEQRCRNVEPSYRPHAD